MEDYYKNMNEHRSSNIRAHAPCCTDEDVVPSKIVDNN